MSKTSQELAEELDLAIANLKLEDLVPQVVTDEITEDLEVSELENW